MRSGLEQKIDWSRLKRRGRGKETEQHMETILSASLAMKWGRERI